MSNITDNQFNLPYNAYAAFDATSLKSLMQTRLTEGGVFTDQIYEGSNFNSLLDIIAYSYNVLLFYLNKTGSETQFSQAQLYENMNRIVKSLNYNPIGFQTSILSFSATAPNTVAPNSYTIPRYSYFSVNGLNYTFTTDQTFIKTNSDEEVLQGLMDSAVLFQGTMVEYPLYIANGSPFEQFSLAAVSPDNTNELIDHNNIHVYVFDESGIWREWSRVSNLFLETPNSYAFECRYNESQRYVIKFGNDVNGKQLKPGYVVAVYYLRSDGATGEIGTGLLNNSRLIQYTTPQFNQIFNNIRQDINYITPDQASSIVFSNVKPSTQFTSNEDVISIRNNAPNIFKSQYRLVTTQDFESYIRTNYNNLINDVKTVNNWDYTGEHLRYLYNIGLKNPSHDSRVLFNQVTFADSCDFNNVYVYVVPKIRKTDPTRLENNYLPAGLKNLIVNNVQNIKLTTSEIVMMDPVYVAVGVGLASRTEIANDELTPEIINESSIVVTKDATSRYSENEIRAQVANILINYFKDIKLGVRIDLDKLTTQILSIDGVTSVATKRVVNDQELTKEGLSLIIFNPVYNNPGEDIESITQSINLPYFKAPFLYNPDTILEQIKVTSPAIQGAAAREY